MTKLIEKRNALFAEAQALVDAAQNEQRVFTDEEKTTYQSKVTEIRSLDEQINAENELRKLELSKNQDQKPAPVGNEREAAEIRAFEAFICGNTETRDATPVNMTFGANGAIVPETIVNKIIDRVVDISPIFASATKYQIKGTITIPKVDRSDGNITVAFTPEFSTLTSNTFAFSSISLGGHTAAALVKISKQLINNSQFDVVGVVVNKMAEALAIFIENFLINGDSNIQNSGMKGSMDSGNILSVASVAALTGDNLIDIQDMIPKAYQKNAYWIMNKTIRNKIRKLKDGQGNYLLVPDYAKGSGDLLLGKPVEVTDNMPTATAATSGQNILYYGDYSGLAVKTGDSAEIEVLREKYAEQHALGINLWIELDAKIENTQKIAALALA